MKTPANYRPETPAPELRAQAAVGAGRGWLPAAVAVPRALNPSHWLSRAARGHTWNGPGVTQRRRSH